MSSTAERHKKGQSTSGATPPTMSSDTPPIKNSLFVALKSHLVDKSVGDNDEAALGDVEWAAVGGVVLWAALVGELQVLKELVSSYDSVQQSFRLCDYADYDKRTALHTAAAGGQQEVVKYLMEDARVRPNPIDRWGYSPLDDAERFAKRTGRWKVFNMLRQDYEARPGPGNEETGMIKSAYFGDAPGIERLAEARHVQGKAVNPPDYDDRTPLHLAASQGNHEVVASLLGQGIGADADIKDRWNRRPVDDAQDGLKKYTKLNNKEKMKDYKKCVDLLEKKGRTPAFGTGASPRCMWCSNVMPTYHTVDYKSSEDPMLAELQQTPGEEEEIAE
mmetsp:Transcript_11569/g.28010  ORF Transcript_11569/g.28010 Transcript_11569/m.28010 type:complete len:333 (+) Transcript_11569:60-1058(+)